MMDLGDPELDWVRLAGGMGVEAARAETLEACGELLARSYPTGCACRFDRRRQLDSIVERLAWAAVRTAPQPYRVVTADVRDG